MQFNKQTFDLTLLFKVESIKDLNLTKIYCFNNKSSNWYNFLKSFSDWNAKTVISMYNIYISDGYLLRIVLVMIGSKILKEYHVVTASWSVIVKNSKVVRDVIKYYFCGFFNWKTQLILFGHKTYLSFLWGCRCFFYCVWRSCLLTSCGVYLKRGTRHISDIYTRCLFLCSLT